MPSQETHALRPMHVPLTLPSAHVPMLQVLVFFTWVVRGVADSVSSWDAVERAATYATQVPAEEGLAVHQADDDEMAAKPQEPGSQAAARMRRRCLPCLACPGSSRDVVSTAVVADTAPGADASIVLCCQGQSIVKGGASSSEGPITGRAWPANGDLVFEDVSLRYFPGGPLALRAVTFHVSDHEKVQGRHE
jgi:hypothetical protein